MMRNRRFGGSTVVIKNNTGTRSPRGRETPEAAHNRQQPRSPATTANVMSGQGPGALRPASRRAAYIRMVMGGMDELPCGELMRGVGDDSPSAPPPGSPVRANASPTSSSSAAGGNIVSRRGPAGWRSARGTCGAGRRRGGGKGHQGTESPSSAAILWMEASAHPEANLEAKPFGSRRIETDHGSRFHSILLGRPMSGQEDIDPPPCASTPVVTCDSPKHPPSILAQQSKTKGKCAKHDISPKHPPQCLRKGGGDDAGQVSARGIEPLASPRLAALPQHLSSDPSPDTPAPRCRRRRGSRPPLGPGRPNPGAQAPPPPPAPGAAGGRTGPPRPRRATAGLDGGGKHL